jgi:prepilin-type N-terminal cleavage/methylation domain-containing protein
MKSIKNLRQGFTLVEIMIVVAIIGLLAAIAIPNFVNARETAQANACINNLRQIDGAKQQWALENNQPGTAVPVRDDIAPYIGRSVDSVTAMGCPAGGDDSDDIDASYNILAVTVSPTCIIFGADPDRPHILQ